jgi:uncharacterized membrane protein YgcG/uncharacterized protein YxeA
MNKNIIITLLALLIIPVMSLAIYVENTDGTSQYNVSTSVNIIVWADSEALNNVKVDLIKDASVSADKTNVSIGNIGVGNFGAATFKLRSDVPGIHTIRANITYTGGSYLHTFAFTSGSSDNNPEFRLDLDYNSIVEVNENFYIGANLTNEGTGVDTNVLITITLPDGASTSYSSNAFNILPGQTVRRTIAVNSSTIGAKSFIITADGDNAYTTKTIRITTTNPVVPDMEVRSLSIPSVVVNRSATISCKLDNNGLDNENAVVNFYINDTLNETKTVSIDAISSETVSFAKTFTSGTYAVNITVDPVSGETDLSNNNVYGTFTTTTSSGGGSPSGGGSHGGSSGGSSSSGGYIAPTVSSKFLNFVTTNSIDVKVKVGDVLFFVFNGVSHNITIKSLTLKNVSLVVQSTPKNMTLNINDTKNVDFDDNKVDDMSISLKDISLGIAELNITMLGKSTSVNNVSANLTKTNVSKQTTTVPTKPTSKESEENPEFDSSAGYSIVSLDEKRLNPVKILFVALLAIIVLALIIIGIVFGIRKIKKADRKRKMSKRKELKEKIAQMENDLEDYKKQLKKR